jgi:hypothetical protein
LPAQEYKSLARVVAIHPLTRRHAGNTARRADRKAGRSTDFSEDLPFVDADAI